MRFVVILAPAFLLLAGAGYFIARPKEIGAMAALEARLDRSPMLAEDRTVDDYDAELIRNALKTSNLSDADSAALVGAAGRRYMRRKMAYDQAKQDVDA